MIYLKDSQDPLQTVSKMDVIIVYSITQVKLPSFKKVMIKGPEYNQLSEEQQKAIEEKLAE